MKDLPNGGGEYESREVGKRKRRLIYIWHGPKPRLTQARDPKTGAPLVDHQGNPVMVERQPDERHTGSEAQMLAQYSKRPEKHKYANIPDEPTDAERLDLALAVTNNASVLAHVVEGLAEKAESGGGPLTGRAKQWLESRRAIRASHASASNNHRRP